MAPLPEAPSVGQTPIGRSALSTATGTLAGGAGGVLVTQLFDVGDLLNAGTPGIIVFGCIVLGMLGLAGFTAYLKAKYD